MLKKLSTVVFSRKKPVFCIFQIIFLNYKKKEQSFDVKFMKIYLLQINIKDAENDRVGT